MLFTQIRGVDVQERSSHALNILLSPEVPTALTLSCSLIEHKMSLLASITSYRVLWSFKCWLNSEFIIYVMLEVQ